MRDLVEGDLVQNVKWGPQVSMWRFPTATVAATGTLQTDAAPIDYGFTFVTGANAAKGVLLPAAVPGAIVIVKNDAAAAAILKVWPANLDAINALGANNSMSIASSVTAWYIAFDTTTWYSLPLLPS